MTNHELRFRQVHLDFHTSEHLTDLGSRFDPQEFAATLRGANVDSVTLFSRCHHGWIYHDTKFPNKHPHLKRDLLAEQIEACHRADIRCPIYITVGWDEYAARLHPEWVEVDANGVRHGRKPLQNGGGWLKLDFASEYVDYLIAQIEEVIDRFGPEIDGFFFDIIHQWSVHSESCMKEYRRLNLDPANPEHQQHLRDELKLRTVQRISDFVRSRLPNVTIFHNGGHVGPLFRKMIESSTHLEVESLPTGGWGYSHFPITARYARTLGKDFLGMTGKFSETWGHFNSYKNKAALEYECFSALAQGGKCSVGDQLHPSGLLDPKTYRLVGDVYREVEAKEPWCQSARAVAEIAVLNAEEFDTSAERQDPRNLGAYRIFQEGYHQFDFVDSQADFKNYRLLVLPDIIDLNPDLKTKIESFVQSGGKVLATGRSGLGLSGFPSIGTGDELPTSPDFVQTDLTGESDTEFVMYERGVRVSPSADATILAKIVEPFFERSYAKFVSHAHTPPGVPSQAPAVLATDAIVHIVHPVFTTYATHSMAFHRDLVLACVDRLLPEPLVKVQGAPRSLQASVTQLVDGRRVLHLLHYIPERRGLRFDIVEDPMFVKDVRIGVAGDWTPMRQPGGRSLAYEVSDGRTWFEIDGFLGHELVELTPLD